MKSGKLHKFLKALFAIIFILGTVAILYIGWKTQDNIQKGNVDTSLNTLVCSNGKGYNLGTTTFNSKKDVQFLIDLEFRYICVHGFDLSNDNKQKTIDDIFSNDRNYFSNPSDIPVEGGKGWGFWPLANPSNIYSVDNQKTKEEIEADYKQVNKNLYDNISYKLVNNPPSPIKPDYGPTWKTLLLFWFILYILRRFTYFVVSNKKLNEMRLGFRENLHFKNPLIIPSIIIGICILIVAYLVINNSASSNAQEAISINQKCHDLATKYVDGQKTKYNGNDNSQPYTYDTLLESYTYNQDLKTCLVQYVVFKYVNALASPAPSPVPDDEHQSIYVDDVIAGKNIGSFYYTECNSNSSYCPSLVNWSFQLQSWGLTKIGFWETLYLQTFDKIPFVRSWLGV